MQFYSRRFAGAGSKNIKDANYWLLSDQAIMNELLVVHPLRLLTFEIAFAKREVGPVSVFHEEAALPVKVSNLSG